MGMDVYGLEPKSEEGKYFRASVWSWRPIALLCQTWFPDLWGKIEYPDTNDGSGLNAEDSLAMGRWLQSRIERGDLKRFIKEYEAELAALKDEPCTYCDSTGIRQGKECNVCRGKGSTRPFATHYPMHHEHIEQWAAFLVDCGGFEIW